MLRNCALWLVKNNHVTWHIQLEHFIPAMDGKAALKYVCDIGAWIKDRIFVINASESPVANLINILRS